MNKAQCLALRFFAAIGAVAYPLGFYMDLDIFSFYESIISLGMLHSEVVRALDFPLLYVEFVWLYVCSNCRVGNRFTGHGRRHRC